MSGQPNGRREDRGGALELGLEHGRSAPGGPVSPWNAPSPLLDRRRRSTPRSEAYDPAVTPWLFTLAVSAVELAMLLHGVFADPILSYM